MEVTLDATTVSLVSVLAFGGCGLALLFNVVDAKLDSVQTNLKNDLKEVQTNLKEVQTNLQDDSKEAKNDLKEVQTNLKNDLKEVQTKS